MVLERFALLSVYKLTSMTSAVPGVSDYMQLYQYLPVLSVEQIMKLRKIAIGILDISSFTEDEKHQLEEKLQVTQEVH